MDESDFAMLGEGGRTPPTREELPIDSKTTP